MRVLIVGGGGREHALGWKIKQSPLLETLYFAPGNPGTQVLGQNVACTGKALIAFAQAQAIDLVVVGPEQPLVDGLADDLEAVGIPCFGPKAGAARLEASKAFSKEVMQQTGVPTAAYRAFDDYEPALIYAKELGCPLVVKADGLAAGKGVTICSDLFQAEKALREAMQERKFGEAGSRVVIEEFLVGTEVSFHLICDGTNFLPLVTAKDHKALLEGDQGPNTGGMGTYAPNPLISPQLALQIQKDLCEPILEYLRAKGHPFRGVLFAGLMLTQQGPKVLEYNVRFGDPETQVMMPLLDFDLLPVLMGAARGSLPIGNFATRAGAATCVVLASHGYPESPRKGDKITIPANTEQACLFHAGTRLDSAGNLVTHGGRVLGATAWGNNLEEARERAYELVNQVTFHGMYYRKDIGG